MRIDGWMDGASGGDGLHSSTGMDRCWRQIATVLETSRILSLGVSFLSRAVLTVAMLGDSQVISHSWEKW